MFLSNVIYIVALALPLLTGVVLLLVAWGVGDGKVGRRVDEDFGERVRENFIRNMENSNSRKEGTGR